MKPTLEYIKEQFATFNRAYFGGKLPEPAFALSHARTVLGQFSCHRSRSWLTHRRKLAGCTIKISTYYDMPERECQNVLLHEMIHYYIAYNGISDTLAHGPAFRTLMERLNSCHGWGIKVRTDTRRWAAAGEQKQQSRLVLALTMADGKRFLTVVNRRYRDAIECKVRGNKDIASHRWVETSNEYFRDFPAVRSLRARRVSLDVYLEASGDGSARPTKGTTPTTISQ